MNVKTFHQEGVSVIQVTGEINITTSPELKKALGNEPAKKMVVDLAGVSYIDSSGLATLVEMLKRSRVQGGTLGLAGMTQKVRSLFEITKLDRLFSIYSSQEDALKKVQ